MYKLILTLALLFSSVALWAREPFQVGFFQLEPFTMADEETGEPSGTVIDYWREYIGPAMGLELVFRGPYPINRVSKMLENGEIDAAALFTKIPAREAIFVYPATILSEISSCLIVRNDSPIIHIARQEDLLGMRIGFITGGYIPPLLVHPRIDLELISNVDYRFANLKKLLGGRIDAVLDINTLSLSWYLAHSDFGPLVRTVALPVENSVIYSIFPDTPQGRADCAAFDRQNARGLKEGVLAAMLKKYFPKE